MKASNDRKIQGIIDEIPSRFTRELRNLEQKDSALFKEQSNNIQALSEQIMKLKQANLL